MKTIGYPLAMLACLAFSFNSSAQTVSGQIDGYDYVDLGLGVKWATYNVGGEKPTDFGGYFAWGETETKTSYTWENYKWCNGSFNSLTRYCTIKKMGKRDKTTELIPNDDAATTNWSPAWRMPSADELQALVDSCKWEWTNNYNKSGVAGSVGTSKINGNTIFLPAAGFFEGDSVKNVGVRGQYISNKIADYDKFEVFNLWFGNTSIENDFIGRQYGNSIRAVTKGIVPKAKNFKKR